MNGNRRIEGNKLIIEGIDRKPQLSIEEEYKKKVTIFSLQGSIDAITVHDFEDELLAATLMSNKIEIYCNQLNYISNAGIKVLLQIQHLLDEENGILEVYNLNENIIKAFEAMGLMDVLLVKEKS